MSTKLENVKISRLDICIVPCGTQLIIGDPYATAPHWGGALHSGIGYAPYLIWRRVGQWGGNWIYGTFNVSSFFLLCYSWFNYNIDTQQSKWVGWVNFP